MKAEGEEVHHLSGSCDRVGDAVYRDGLRTDIHFQPIKHLHLCVNALYRQCQR